jgi:hypothetical protein
MPTTSPEPPPLIHREDRETGAVLYLLTSAHLFRDPQGGPPPRIQVARVLLGGELTLDVSSDDIFVYFATVSSYG